MATSRAEDMAIPGRVPRDISRPMPPAWPQFMTTELGVLFARWKQAHARMSRRQRQHYFGPDLDAEVTDELESLLVSRIVGLQCEVLALRKSIKHCRDVAYNERNRWRSSGADRLDLIGEYCDNILKNAGGKNVRPAQADPVAAPGIQQSVRRG